MKLPASAKTSTFIKHKIKKGYYPAKLVSVKPYADSNDVLIDGKYGHQLIFSFGIYNSDAEGLVTDPVLVKDAEGKEIPLEISRFVYFNSKETVAPGAPQTYRTAVTPNSRITKTLEAMGWKFTEEGVDPDTFIGKWLEVNVDDYTKKLADGSEEISSTIKDVGKLEFKPKEGEAEKPQSTPTPKAVVEDGVREDAIGKSEAVIALEAKIEQLKDFHKSELINDKALADGIEQIEAKIEAQT